VFDFALHGVVGKATPRDNGGQSLRRSRCYRAVGYFACFIEVVTMFVNEFAESARPRHIEYSISL